MPRSCSTQALSLGSFLPHLLAIAIVVLQMLLIPAYGLFGAALATSLASIAYNLLLLISVWKFFGLQPFDQRNLKVLMILLLSFAIALLIPHLQTGGWISHSDVQSLACAMAERFTRGTWCRNSTGTFPGKESLNRVSPTGLWPADTIAVIIIPRRKIQYFLAPHLASTSSFALIPIGIRLCQLDLNVT